jgi:hypothetical protein
MSRAINSIEDVQELFSATLKELAEENKVEPKDLTIVIQKYKCEEPGKERDEFVFLEFIKRGEETDFNRELDVPRDIVKPDLVDFHNTEMKLRLVLGFMAGMLREELAGPNGGCELYDVRVEVYTNQNDPIDVKMIIYKEGSSIGRRELTWDQLADIAG